MAKHHVLCHRHIISQGSVHIAIYVIYVLLVEWRWNWLDWAKQWEGAYKKEAGLGKIGSYSALQQIIFHIKADWWSFLSSLCGPILSVKRTSQAIYTRARIRREWVLKGKSWSLDARASKLILWQCYQGGICCELSNIQTLTPRFISFCVVQRTCIKGHYYTKHAPQANRSMKMQVIIKCDL